MDLAQPECKRYMADVIWLTSYGSYGHESFSLLSEVTDGIVFYAGGMFADA